MSNVFDQARAQWRAAYDEQDRLIYTGHADAATADNEKGWIIQKTEYNAKGFPIGGFFPGDSFNRGNSYANHIWTERENYNYVRISN